jgi:hypothetical protein
VLRALPGFFFGQKRRGPMEEVKTLREVPKTPECCGEKMRKMQDVSSGKMLTVYVCTKQCGRQMRVPDA